MGLFRLSFGSENWLMLVEAGMGINTMETIVERNASRKRKGLRILSSALG
jgi:hypothetical protein